MLFRTRSLYSHLLTWKCNSGEKLLIFAFNSLEITWSNAFLKCVVLQMLYFLWNYQLTSWHNHDLTFWQKIYQCYHIYVWYAYNASLYRFVASCLVHQLMFINVNYEQCLIMNVQQFINVHAKFIMHSIAS